MPRILCDGRELVLQPGDNLLDALLAAGLSVASSCRAGACQQCMVQAVQGTPPARAQEGLKDAQRHQGYFLACQAQPSEDLTLSVAGARGLDVPARISSVEAITLDVLRVLVRPEKPLRYKPGQYITLVRPDGFVAWRSAGLTDQLRGDLRAAPDRVLGRET